MSDPITHSYTLLLERLDEVDATFSVDPALGAGRNDIGVHLPRADWVALGHPSWISVHVTPEVSRG